MNDEKKSRFKIATEWFYALQDPNLSVEKLQEWQNWLSESPENAKEYERVEEVLNLTGDTEGLLWPDDRDLLSDDYDGDISVKEWNQRTNSSQNRRHRKISFIPQFKWKPSRLTTFSGALLSFCMALLVVMLFSRPADDGDSLHVSVYESSTAENRDIKLSDGSIITLGAQSLVSVAFSQNLRQIVLQRGEAYFNVAKDPSRPFNVTTGNRVVTAVGTEFNISKQDERVVVTVAEGKISIKPETQSDEVDSEELPIDAYLVAGQRVSYSESSLSDIQEARLHAILGWRQGKLHYLGEEMRYVIEDINRYSDVKIKFTDEASKSLRYSGTVFTANLKDWIDILPHAFPVTVHYAAENEVTISYDG